MSELNFKKDLYQSLMTSAGGFSGRKISAFVAIGIAMIITLRNTNTESLTTILSIWLIFALLCLGLVTFEQLIKLKNGSSSITEFSTTESSTSSSSTSTETKTDEYKL